ncbi:hypothetical protein XELAEV_18038215mg [Xenopus laevis]|uniref:Uncharacterized protein n=1 Tax=Xenopus laevis TaxID=8355 RepID=A0A974H6N5_XENLA|nr:hypothetical protein XELAEV_18038215mg [Xenopus laevis]
MQDDEKISHLGRCTASDLPDEPWPTMITNTGVNAPISSLMKRRRKLPIWFRWLMFIHCVSEQEGHLEEGDGVWCSITLKQQIRLRCEGVPPKRRPCAPISS